MGLKPLSFILIPLVVGLILDVKIDERVKISKTNYAYNYIVAFLHI